MSENFTPKVYTDSYYDYEKTGKPISVIGRLKKNISYWKAIGCSEYIQSVITKGYVIPIKGDIEPVDLSNNRSSKQEPTFVWSAIDELLQTGAIKELTQPPLVINPLTVAKKGSKLRLVIDLRHLKKQVVMTKCKFEGLETAIQFLRQDGFMTAFDLKSGYHHIDIVDTQHTLLGFAFTDWQGNRRFFQYQVLPFGLSTAGQIFTKVIRQLIKHWRGNCIQAVVFLDDGLQSNTNEHLALQHSMIIKGSLISAGFIPNREKSTWVPKQILTWLGFIVDLVQGRIFLTEDRILKTENLIDYILGLDTVPIKLLSKVNGLIISMEKSHGELVYLKTRFLCLCIAEAESWFTTEVLCPPVREELIFWRTAIREENGQSILTPPASTQITYSDASATGSATIVTGGKHTKTLVATTFFNESEKARSSTERELLGILHGLIRFKEVLSGHSVTWHTDCKNLVRIVKRGSMKPYILNLAVACYKVAKSSNIILNVVWIPRRENEEADFWSRVVDYNDWGIQKSWYDKICKACNMIPDVDRFADNDNKKCIRYNSRFYHHQAEAVDALTQNWGNDKNWVVPPIHLVNRSLEHAIQCEAEIILVVPKWPSAIFWPKLKNLMIFQSQRLKHKIVMGNIFTRGRTNSSIFGSPDWKGETLALHFNFK